MNFPIIWAFQTEVSILCHTPFEGQSPWSEQDTCVPSCTCLECTWWREQRKTTNVHIIFTWEVPMTTQHGVLQLNCCSYDRNVLLLLV